MIHIWYMWREESTEYFIKNFEINELTHFVLTGLKY